MLWSILYTPRHLSCENLDFHQEYDTFTLNTAPFVYHDFTWWMEQASHVPESLNNKVNISSQLC